MKGDVSKMKKFLKWLDEDFEESILMIFLIVMSVVMMAQVIMRYFFKASMTWPEEFCRFMFVFSGFLSIGKRQPRQPRPSTRFRRITPIG